MKKLVSAILAVLMLCAMLVPCAMADQDAIRKSTVRVYAEGVDPSTGEQSAWIGTAFAVGDGEAGHYFVTNKHVVDGALYIWIIYDTQENRVPCNVKAVSSRCDLAVLEVDSKTDVPCTPAVLRPFADGEFKDKTERVWTYGYPAFAMGDKSTSTGDLLKADLVVADGTISQVQGHSSTNAGEMIMHTAKMSGGNSGGPLVDKDGRVVGVNTMWLPANADQNHTDYFYSISVNEVVRLLDEEKVPYTTKATGGSQKNLIIGVAAAAVVIVAAVLAILLRKKGGKGGQRVLYCEVGDLQGKSFNLKARTTVGRVAKNCDIAFPNEAKGVSALHCTISYEQGVVKVRDENSSYGTWIDETRLTPGQAVVMHRGQKLYLGSKKQCLTLRS